MQVTWSVGLMHGAKTGGFFSEGIPAIMPDCSPGVRRDMTMAEMIIRINSLLTLNNHGKWA
jgi:hypothetical protein